MIHGIPMSKKTLKDLKLDAHIAVLHTKVDSLIEKQKELTGRVRANEKVVAAIGLLGSIAVAFIGAGYFAPKAEAHMGHSFPTAGEWIQKLREHESKRNRISIEDMLDASLIDYSNDPTIDEE